MTYDRVAGIWTRECTRLFSSRALCAESGTSL